MRSLRENREANSLFLDVLTDRANPEFHLRRMNEAGVLGRFIPEFGKIVAMMQFSMYHHYTVDEHLLRTIDNLSRIERGELTIDHPMSSELIGAIKDRRALYVALLLHDIAKGRPEDHSVAGARIARRLCPRLGLSERETDLVAWLVEDHLVMSMTAQQRDINDRKTILDFAERVQHARAAEPPDDPDGLRHPGCWPGRLERLEGAAAARRSISRPSRR